MDMNQKTALELVAELVLDPGFLLVPKDRYEELIRAEMERDVLEATIAKDKYGIDATMEAIHNARKLAHCSKSEDKAPTASKADDCAKFCTMAQNSTMQEPV